MANSTIITELASRGLIHQTTHDEIDDALADSRVTLYAGFDPTSDSLHAGSLLPVIGLAHFRRHGHRPLALVGGATGLIGDPSGKSAERNLLDDDTIARNIAGVGAQLRTLLDRALQMHPDGVADGANADEEIPIVNNADWMRQWSYLDFLRDIGKSFRVNVMLQKDSVKNRLAAEESGLSYTEFSYMLIQSYDFLHLFEAHGCTLQIGGSDQWGNITAGTDLIRRRLGEAAFGLTLPLLLSASGEKFGKTARGAVWLDPERTSPYEFYQYWVRREDADVADLLRKFTFVPLDELQELIDAVERGENRGEAQRRLAYEVTWLAHGQDEADKAVRASRMLFGEKIEGLSDRDLEAVFAEVPSSTIDRARLDAGVNIVDLLAEVGLQKSKGAARRLVEQGGAYVNNERIAGIDTAVTIEHLTSETKLVLRAGRKNYHVLGVDG